MLAEEVGSLLRSKGLTLAVAESCTGGKLGDTVTSVPGSSEYFLGGVVSYSDRAKVDLLGVSAETLGTEGAVSESTALQMASGVRERFGADIGAATTGIAGPGGGTPTKPVGLVYVAVSAEGSERVKRNVFAGARDDVKRQSVECALMLIREMLADGR